MDGGRDRWMDGGIDEWKEGWRMERRKVLVLD